LLPLAGTGHGEGDLSVILPLLVETVMETPNIKLVVPKEDTNLGKMGTVRKDSTMKNLPMIREVLGLSEAPKAEPIVKEEAPVTSTDNSNASDVFLSDEEEDGFEPDNDMLNLILQNQNNSSITSGNPSPANASLPGGPEETTLEKDLRELNLTNEVLEYLYNDRIGGGQPISFEAYSREVEDIVDASKANNIPNDVILNQIKCI
jgi:hypothetical protein